MSSHPERIINYPFSLIEKEAGNWEKNEKVRVLRQHDLDIRFCQRKKKTEREKRKKENYKRERKKTTRDEIDNEKIEMRKLASEEWQWWDYGWYGQEKVTVTILRRKNICQVPYKHFILIFMTAHVNESKTDAM